MSRRLGLVFCCCCASAILLSGLFAVSLADHDCCGDECPLCLLVQGALNFSRQLRQAPALPPRIFLPGPLAAGLFVFFAVPASAVRLKVRINR